jgi:hypothetical protein
MATYKEIQQRVRAQAGFQPKTCWIAHVKSDFGLPMRDAPNRAGERQVPCPPDKRPAIIAALRHFQMIR